MDDSPIRFRWLAALTLWTALIGPVLVSPVLSIRSAVGVSRPTTGEEPPRAAQVPVNDRTTDR